MAPDGPARRGWRRDGGPKAGEFALALVVVILIAIGAVVLLGGQISNVVQAQSGAI